MNVFDEVFYHINTNFFYDYIWKVGNVINIDKNYISQFNVDCLNINQDYDECCGFIKREIALEEIRKSKYPSLPSRLNSLFLADSYSVPYWKSVLINKKKLHLYKVSCTGVIFKSSASFLYTSDITSYEAHLRRNKEYWDNEFSDEEDYLKAEYLFRGKIKILEKR